MSAHYETFGKYVLLEKLATGGMAEVFLARGTGAGGIGKFFAIKRILPQYADSPEFIEMFKDEAKIAINLNHSNIVSIHEFGVEKGQFFLVMDYVEGRNLRQILNKMKKTALQFGIDQVVYVIKEVAAGLDHAHRCIDGSTGKPLNITHRDMSPQNIMASFEGEVKIVDFGIAKAESQIETTRAGTLKGKFGYMSPEQAEGQPVDLRTDIFSLGIVLWELLAHDRLFVANNEINTLRKIRDCQIPSLRKINPNIHTELERIVQKGLARDRNLRYQTGAALHRDLNRFLNRQYPDFSPQDFAVFIKSVFADEILSLRKRLVEYSKINLSISLNIPARPVAPQAQSRKSSLLDQNTSSFIVTQTSSEPDDGVPKNLLTKTTRQDATSEVLSKDLFTSVPVAKDETKPDLTRPSTQANRQKSELTKADYTKGATQGGLTRDLTRELSFSGQTAETTKPSDPALELSHLTKPSDPSLEPVSPLTQPTGTAPLLDEKALTLNLGAATTESSLRAKIQPLETRENSGQVETEDLSNPSYRPIPRSASRSGDPNGSRTTRPADPNSTRIVTFVVFALLCFSAYAYLVKYFTNSMSDVIRATDPLLHEVHVALGVSLPERLPTSAGKDLPGQGQSPGLSPDAGQPVGHPAPSPGTVEGSQPVVPIGEQSGMVITSNPSGAEIYLNGMSTGLVTPSRIEVPTQEAFTVSIRKRGWYEFKREDLTRESAGRRLDATLQKMNVGYLDVEIFPPQDAVLFVNGHRIQVHRNIATNIPIPGNTSIKVRAESRGGETFDETTVKIATDRRKSIKLNPRKTNRSPSNERVE